MLRLFKVFYYNFILNHNHHLKSLQIDVTDKCNLFCKGCYHFQGERHKDKSIYFWEDLFKKYKKAKIYNIWLFGGEPTLRMEIVDLAYKYFPLVYVVTNGRIAIPKKYKNMRIYVSLDGLKEYNDFYRGKGTFQDVLNNYKYDNRVVINTTITKNNINQIDDLIRITKTYKFHGIGFQFFSTGEKTNIDKINTFRLTNNNIKQCEDILKKYYTDKKVFITKKLFHTMTREKLSWSTCLFKKYISCYYSDGKKKRCCTATIDCAECKILPVFFHLVLDKYKDICTYHKFINWL